MKLIEKKDDDLTAFPYNREFTCKYNTDGVPGCGSRFFVEGRGDFFTGTSYAPNGAPLMRYYAHCPNCGRAVRLFNDGQPATKAT